MTNQEMNSRIKTLKDDKIEHIQRLLRNGYDARDIYSFRIGATLAQINAVVQLDTHWGSEVSA